MEIVAIGLVAAGLVVSLFGIKLFKMLLPLIGLISGTVAGFTGFQGVFGKGAVSTTIAVFVALIVGVLLALLSFVFFELAITILAGILGASLFSYLGISLGLGKEGFLVFMLSVTGFIFGLIAVGAGPITPGFVITLSAMAGTAFMLAGIFLVVGSVSLDQLQNDGVIQSVLNVVDQSFLWLFVWLAGTLIARQMQISIAMQELFGDSYQFIEK